MYLGKIQTGPSYKKWIIIFILLCIFIIAGAVYVTTAKVKITLTPKHSRLVVDFEVKLKQNPENKNEIFGKILKKDLERTLTFEDVDEKEFPNHAEGKVIIYNKRDKDQPLLNNTQLQAENSMIFRTQAWVNAPADGQVEVRVKADKEGAEGNLPPGKLTIIKLWKNFQELIYAENQEAFSGGIIKKPFVTQETIDRSKNILSNQLFNEAYQEFQKTLNSNEKLADKSIKNETLEFEAKIKPETEIDRFIVNLKTKSRAVIFNENDLKNLAEERLKQSTPTGNEFLKTYPENFNFKITDINEETEITTIAVHLEGDSILKLPQKVFDKKSLVGRDLFEIKTYYKEIAEVENIEVKFSPFWVTSVPGGEEKIEVEVRNE